MVIFDNAEEIRQYFIEDGWSANISFEELSLQEAKDKGYLFAVHGIDKGKKYFKMNGNGNIYDDKGKIVLYNI